MSRATPQAAGTAGAVYYPIKWVLDENGASVPICMQASNGPCPLLALANINLQTRCFTIQPGTTRVREDHLMAILADYVSTHPPNLSTQQSTLLHEHAVSDFLDLLPRLNRGMDINVRFDSPSSFEFTRELGVFDIFPKVRLLHGWLVDPQDTMLAQALGKLSYNQVIDELVRTASPPPPPPVAEEEEEEDELRHAPSAPPPEAFEPSAPYVQGMQYSCTDDDASQFTDVTPEDVEGESVASNTVVMPQLPEETRYTSVIREVRPSVLDFLESNSTQLTIYGLTELHDKVADGDTFVLFRNSHFYVVRKRHGELFTLVTDVGYLNQLNTVWEKLSDINGDSTFYNGCFQRVTGYGVVQDDSRVTAAGPASGTATTSAPVPAPATATATVTPHGIVSNQAASSCGPSAMQPPVAPYTTTTTGGVRPTMNVGSSSMRRRTSASVMGKAKNTDKCVIQ